MAEKFKVGDMVRILDKDEIVEAESLGFKTNEVYPVVRLDSQGDPVITNGTEELYFFTSELQYLEKVSDKPTKNQRISALEKEVAALKDEIEALKKSQGKTVTTTISTKHSADFAKLAEELSKRLAKRKTSLTPNQKASANSLRKAIIDEAKVFVEDGAKVDLLLGRGRGYVKNGVICNVDFVVNAEKRTVVAILRWQYNGNIEAKGIAKCAPDDVFNEHIGKAIALGRALGLDVSKFENAVKPTELVVGHITKGSFMGNGKIYKVTDGKAFVDSGGYWRTKISDSKSLTLLDDTEAQYE